MGDSVVGTSKSSLELLLETRLFPYLDGNGRARVRVTFCEEGSVILEGIGLR